MGDLQDESLSGQPNPVPNDGPSIHDLVIEDLVARKAHGLKKYGVLLQAGNGRSALQDAYEEAVDLACYLRQALEEEHVLFPEQTPDTKLYTESEAFVAGAISTMPPFSNHHPGYCLPIARRALEALGEWEPSDGGGVPSGGMES